MFATLFGKLRCASGYHELSTYWEPAAGGRDVKRCVRCKRIVAERGVGVDEAKRTRRRWL